MSGLASSLPSPICKSVRNKRVIPTQLPTQGQWWSNLAMQRLHTAQCLDLMGFRICGGGGHKKQRDVCRAVAKRPASMSGSLQCLPSRCCRICSDPDSPSPPAPQSSETRHKKGFFFFWGGGRQTYSLCFVWQRNKRSTDDVQAGWDFQLNDHTGDLNDSLNPNKSSPET